MTYAACLSRRQALRGLMCAVAGAAASEVGAAPINLPRTPSLQASLAQARHVQQPLVVMVSLQGCPFCKVVRENYLHPLHVAGLPVVQVDMREHLALLDFDGTPSTHDAWVRQQGIKIAPTVMFFGAQGREVAARLQGAYLPDFYGAYLDQQLTVARRACCMTSD